ncbi:MAG: TetR/AcrR family transcriptional regulator [Lachnospiraceae bacterium]|nr:TetR/AcrR family transcriptional regulator [Robinsoniella sp.]MDY3766321.1 TetR/AcrR family transcriptional regulator [Lachnospiraceae bacterium]
MENKENILKCALDLFYAKGYDAVGVQEIVEKAGITKPTLYYYFGSKYGLLETLLTTKFQLFSTTLKEAAKYNGDIADTLNRVAAAYVNCAMENQKFYMLLMSMFYLPRENEAYKAAKPLISEFFHIIVKIFEDAREQLGNMNHREKQFAVGFMGVINYYLILVCEQGEGKEIQMTEETIRSLVHQFMHGINS